MGASMYYRQSTISAAKQIETSTPQGFMDVMELAFEKREPRLTKKDIPVLFGILCAYKNHGLEWRVFHKLIDALKKYDEVEVFAEY